MPGASAGRSLRSSVRRLLLRRSRECPSARGLAAGADRWPIWATVGHTAGARVYWLCDVIGEPGADTTPFPNAATTGWEDDLDHPRGAHELVEALDSTWRLIEGCLDRWTPEMLAETFHRDYNGQAQVHTRGSILQRLFTHDAYTAASCRRRSASTGCRRSTSGVPIEDLYAVSWSVRKMTSGARLAFTWHVVPSGHPAQERVSTQSAGPGSPVFVRCNLRLRGWE